MIAEKVFDGIKNNNLNVKSIIGDYETSDEQQHIALLLQSDFDFEISVEDRMKTLNELIFNIKKASLEDKISKETDQKKFKELIDKRNKLNINNLM